MLGRGLTAIALAAALVAPALAESPLVVMDANDQVYGEVISADKDLGSVTMLYRLDTGGFALFKVEYWTLIGNFVFSYYEGSTCGGQPLFELPADYTPRIATYVHRLTWEPGIPGYSIMRYSGSNTGALMTTRSFFHPTSGCVGTGATQRTVVLAEFVEYLRTPPPPFHIELNPILFQDQFQTGDLSRWSNY